MSTIDTKLSKSIKQLQIHYSVLMGPEAVGMYCRMLWFESTSINKIIDMDYLESQTLPIHWPSVLKLIKKLVAFRLLKKTKEIKDDGFSWNYETISAKNLTAEEKKQAVFRMYKYHAIDKEEHDILIEYIDENSVVSLPDEGVEDIIEKSYQDEDFEEIRKKINPDTGMGLVIHYYHLLSNTFGGRFLSRNLKQEAANLKICMAKNGDTPEKTREYFAWVINKSKRENKFDRVSGLGLYPEHRKEAHYAIDVLRSGHKKFEQAVDDTPREEKIMKNMKGVYALYMEDGLLHDDAMDKMKKNFSEDAIVKFMETLNAR